jgi:hypothetical protein
MVDSIWPSYPMNWEMGSNTQIQVDTGKGRRYKHVKKNCVF